MIKLKSNSCNCPNCGSPITDVICEYCGTVIYDFANLDPGKISYIRLKFGGNLFAFKARVTSVNAEISNNEPTLYFDNSPVRLVTNEPASIHVTVEMDVVPDDGILFLKFKEP